MAYAIHPRPLRPIDRLAAPFRALGRLLIFLAVAGPRMAAIERLNGESDAALAARGTTREAEVRRILGGYGHI